MPTSYRSWVIATCWLAAAARYRSLFANHFHADEALFAGWARQIAVWRDPLLLTQAVDKPPLLFYLQALAFPFFGPVEWAARLPNFVASLLLVPLVAVLAWRLYGDGPTAVIVALLLALSPLAIQFSATAFTDPLLTFWLVAAFALATQPAAGDGPVRAGWAGMCFGLAVATKYQAWLFLPLLIALALLGGWSRREWGRGIAGAAIVGGVVLAWLLARPEAAPLLGQQIANAGGLRLAWSWELWPRLASWAGLSRLALGWPLLIVIVIAAAVWLLRAGRSEGPRSFDPITPLLALFLAAYGVAHWLFAVPVWDRYLLPVLPFALLPAARLIAVALQRLLGRDAHGTNPRLAQAITVLLVVVLAVPAAEARLGRWPIGGQPTADQGAWRVAEQLREAPYGTVLYDHWYSWQWRYHLFDSGVYVSWFPHGDALREDLAVFGDDGSPRYLVLPAGPAADPVRRAVAGVGFALVAQPLSTASDPAMMLYRLEKTTR
jgi:4-amino-4-deoxy-L-arabinose transferase-like glycosyltransferase